MENMQDQTMRVKDLRVGDLPDAVKYASSIDFSDASEGILTCKICGNQTKIGYTPPWLFQLMRKVSSAKRKEFIFCEKCHNEYSPGLTMLVLDLVESRCKQISGND